MRAAWKQIGLPSVPMASVQTLSPAPCSRLSAVGPTKLDTANSDARAKDRLNIQKADIETIQGTMSRTASIRRSGSVAVRVGSEKGGTT